VLHDRLSVLRDSARGLEGYEADHQLDLDIHVTIPEAEGNSMLRMFIDGLNLRIMHLRIVHRPDRLGAASAEHIEIIDALLGYDPEGARETMCMHLRHSRENRAVG
jgi:DNA-binding FadR family transcriptional regulator